MATYLLTSLTNSKTRVLREFIAKYSETPCNNVHEIVNTSEQCNFVRSTDSCSYDGVIYSYTELTYCQLGNVHVLSFIVLLAILLFLFIAIGIVADDFLCPSLLTISKTLRLPDNIAGVTFLAFGNGAPDIFASIGGISHSKPQLIFSSLYGAGIFVTTVVTGSVLITGEFGVMKRPVMRDILCYIGASFLVWLFIFGQKLRLAHSISLVCYYIGYISVIVVGRFIYMRMNRNRVEEEVADVTPCELPRIGDVEYDARSLRSIDPPSRKHSFASYASNSSYQDGRKRTASFDEDVVLTRFYRRGTLHTPRRSRTGSQIKQHLAHHHFENTIRRISKAFENVDEVRYTKDVIESKVLPPTPVKKQGYRDEVKFTNNISKPKYLQQFSSLSTSSILSARTMLSMLSETKNFFLHICPIDILEWNTYRFHRKALEVVKAIPYFAMTICIPIVDLESINENWCRLLICLNILTAPQVVLFLLDIDVTIRGKMPLWSLLLVISVVLAFVVFFTSNKNKPPIYHRLFAFIGFGVSVVFINAIANEVINILQTFGIIFKLTDSILGLTILAWGNSLGDLIADLSMARHGYPGMAIAACFGGPMLNLLMGIGVPYLILFANGEREVIEVEYNNMITLLFTTLIVSLATSLINFILRGFKSSRVHGILLIAIYLCYVTLALLIEFHVIPHGGHQVG